MPVTIEGYEAVALHRGNVVVELPSREIVDDWPTIDQARQHAADLNRWLASQPLGIGLIQPTNDPTPERLLMSIERIFDPDRRLDDLEKDIQTVVGLHMSGRVENGA